MAAHITLDQVGLPPGVLDEARDDGLDNGALVTATATGYISTFRMELLWVGQHPAPDNSALVTFNKTGSGYTFNPEASTYGTWVIRLITDEGTPNVDEITIGFSIKQSPTALRIPAPQERGDPTASLGHAGALQKRRSWFNKPESVGPFSGAGGTWAPWWRPHADLLYAYNTIGGVPVPNTRTISTTAPLTGGGDLSTNRTFAISAATTLAAGSMSAADKTKLDGLPSSAPPTTRAINTTAPLSGGGDLSADRTLTISAATTLAAGSMSAADKTKLDALSNFIAFVAVSGTTKTLALADATTTQECTNASGCTITIPTDASVAYTVGTLISFIQEGAAQVTISDTLIVAAGGVLNSSGSEKKTARQWAEIFLKKTGTNTWHLTGEKTT